ncbi:Uncharacterised protein [Mycobacteroides abscessus subsp. abscessus]|nr:Uncharacterised protein [Mycobacteroides abscessus subsp. abscessus]
MQPGLHSIHQLLTCAGVTLFDLFLCQRGRSGARGVHSRDGETTALLAPIAVHLTHDQLRRSRPQREVVGPGVIGRRRSETYLEAAVALDVDLSIVESDGTARHVLVGVVTASEHLETQIGSSTAFSGDHVLILPAHPGPEVKSVGVVQAHLGKRTGTGEQEWVVPVGVKRHVRAGGYPLRQILKPFQQVGFGFDMRGRDDQLLRLDDGSGEGFAVHIAPDWYRFVPQW